MRGFSPGDRGPTAEFEPIEAALLRQLAGELSDLLNATVSGTETLAGFGASRLLPDAYADDPDATDEFRRYTGPDVLGRKERNALVLAADLAEAASAGQTTAVTLADDSVGAWLRCLTDLRLLLAERIGLFDEQGATDAPLAAEDDDERAAHEDIYDFLGWVQESLVAAVDAADEALAVDPEADDAEAVNAEADDAEPLDTGGDTRRPDEPA